MKRVTELGISFLQPCGPQSRRIITRAGFHLSELAGSEGEEGKEGKEGRGCAGHASN